MAEEKRPRKWCYCPCHPQRGISVTHVVPCCEHSGRLDDDVAQQTAGWTYTGKHRAPDDEEDVERWWNEGGSA